jgi:flagellin-like hook-associated protein FlgL
VSAESKAIELLKSQLANGTGADATAVAKSAAGSTTGVAGGNIKGSATPAADLTFKSYTDANGDAYGAGTLYTAVIDADKTLGKAETAIGSYTSSTNTGTGTAGTLGTALTKAGIAWDGTAATLEASDMAAKLETAYADPTNDGLKEAVAAYRSDVSDLATAKTAMTDSVKAYETATKQLTALTTNKTATDQQATADTYAGALKATMNAGLDTATQIAYSDVVVNDDGTLGTGTTHAAAAATDTLRTAAKEAYAKALDTVASKVASGAMAAGKAKTALLNINAAFMGGATGGTQINSATSGDNYAAALDTLKTDKAAVTTVAADLKSAQDNVVSKFSGPAVLTGSNVGVNGAGEVVSTANGNNAITLTANASGVGGQISGFNISVSDSNGNVKKSANASLDAFDETVRAQNESADNAIALQVGSKANQSIKVGLTDMRSEALGLKGADGTKLNISTQTKANAAVNVLDNALQKALDQQTTIGSVESRLEYTSSNLTTASSNVQSSESTIRDADMAKEMTEYTKNNVLLQAAQSMLSQANQNSSSVLSLLK